MKIAYLCNVYPAPTHTFIRREILAVAQNGMDVERISIRRFTGELPSSWDREELHRTFCVLDRNLFSIVFDALFVASSSPYKMLRTIWRLLRLAPRSEAGILKHFAYLVEACVVLRHTRRQHVEHIHAHFGTNAATVAMLVGWLGGPRFSCTFHGPGEWDCPEFLHIPQKVKEAAFISVISDFAKSQTYRWSASDYWPKIHVIRCGVDEAFLSRPISPVPDVKNLIMIGRLGRSKGHVVLLKALERLAADGIECRVKLVGDGPMRGFIEQQVRARELQS
ncbi:MAG: glycosyltransferase, partial [Woeseiaceae bacterium]